MATATKSVRRNQEAKTPEKPQDTADTKAKTEEKKSTGFRTINLAKAINARSRPTARSVFARAARAMSANVRRRKSNDDVHCKAAKKAAAPPKQKQKLLPSQPNKQKELGLSLRKIRQRQKTVLKGKKSASVSNLPSHSHEEDEELMGDPIDMMTTGDGGQRCRGPVDPRVSFAQTVLEQGALYVMKKFRRVQRYKGAELTFQAFNENRDKNRYQDIRCLDSTRVILQNRSNDYIHANWINSADGRRFICAQGPMEGTVGDFWEMLVQEGCRTIIMLCALIEEDKEKCFLYYPTSLGSSITIESTCITLIEQSSDALTRSLWNVKCRDTEFQVRHVQCTTWPDHSAPLDAAAALEIHKEISNSPPSHPILVHCSAGVGRTCAVVGIELMLERIRSRRFQSGASVVRTMRRARYGAVQKPIQFLFMHLVLLELFCTEGVFRSDNRLMVSFREAYSSLITKADEIRKRKQKNSKPNEDTKPREVATI